MSKELLPSSQNFLGCFKTDLLLRRFATEQLFFSFWIWKFYTTEYKKEQSTKANLVILLMWYKPVLYKHVEAVFKFPLEKYEFYPCILFSCLMHGLKSLRSTSFLRKGEETKETNRGSKVRRVFVKVASHCHVAFRGLGALGKTTLWIFCFVFTASSFI